ncbi:MAG: fatty acid desaturase [Candidatus Abawacabacteria bacterium]|nr:fatty acid desaturase [Candidatus Abawacabacteria bacterium]
MNTIEQQQKDFTWLSQEVSKIIHNATWYQAHGWEFLKLGLRITLFCLGFFVVAQNYWLSTIIGLLIMSYAHGGIAISGIHQARHQSFCQSYWCNRILGYLFSDFWVGQSNEWWHETHDLIHHPNTNIPSIDPPSFYFPWINRYVYFLFIPFLAVFWFYIKSAIYLWGRWQEFFLFLLTATAGWAFHIGLFTSIVSLPLAILYAYLLRSLFAPLFMHLAVFNHVGLDTPKKRLPWLYHQLLTTRNIKKSWFLTGLGGNAFVECHTEHHLFPNIPNHLLNKIRPLIKKFAEEHNYPYFEEKYFAVLAAAIRDYDKVFSVAERA